MKTDWVLERVALQNIITSHTSAYPQPSDLTPYGAHKEIHPMLASDPDQKPRRTDRTHCPRCEASAAGCRSVQWLSGRLCCSSCPGSHDAYSPGCDT